ncbi:MAG: hypothetical protein VYD70_09050 [Planctomycetota bacterium]|nr:hypothetical protein [Planctomycetota bacterium]
MTRLLLVTSILTTLVLFRTLAERPPVPVEPQIKSEIGSTSTTEDSTPTIANDRPREAQPWPADLQLSARKALDEWNLEHNLLPQLSDPLPRSAPEELLRAEWICKRSLLEMAANASHESDRFFHLRLNSGDVLRYQDMKIHEGISTLKLIDGVRVRIPVSEILETRVVPIEKSSHKYLAGSLGDTLDVIDLLAKDKSIPQPRWIAWFESGGPETLARLLSSADGIILDSFVTRFWRTPPVQAVSQSTDGKSPKELANWMLQMRKKLREGFPTEEREETLLILESWQTWLDRNGTKAYRSRQIYVQTSRDLRLLQLDIVKSTGF